MSPPENNDNDQQRDGTPLGDSDDRTFLGVIRYFLANARRRDEKTNTDDLPEK